MESEKKNVVAELEELLDRKKKNDTGVAKELLETKYKKHYDSLKNNISENLIKVINSFVLMGFEFIKGDDEDEHLFVEKAKKVIDEESKKGTFKKAQEVAFTTYSLDKALEVVIPVHERISTEAYMEYWLSKCIPCTAPGYSYYNSIIEMYYNAEHQQWEKEENGVITWTIKHPPTREMYEKDSADNIAATTKQTEADGN